MEIGLRCPLILSYIRRYAVLVLHVKQARGVPSHLGLSVADCRKVDPPNQLKCLLSLFSSARRAINDNV